MYVSCQLSFPGKRNNTGFLTYYQTGSVRTCRYSYSGPVPGAKFNTINTAGFS
jgi:hypothetical protein